MKVIIAYFFLLVAFACLSQGDKPEEGSYFIKISNKKLIESIRQYVFENKIDCSEKIITVEVVGNDNQVFLIASEISEVHTYDQAPTFYSTIDDKVIVFIYTGAESLIDKESQMLIVNGINRLLKAQNVRLQKFGKTYSRPVWRLVKCGNEYMLEKEVQPFVLNHIPCGYSIEQDSIRLDSLILKRRE
jgi:hypothetical protein